MTPIIAGSINRTPTGLHRRYDMFIITRGNEIGTYLICLDCESPFQQFSYDSKGYVTLDVPL